MRFCVLQGLFLMLVASACSDFSSGGGSPPSALSIVGTTFEGPSNDTIVVAFSAPMVEAEIEDFTNWRVESSIGTPFDVSGVDIDYDASTRTATVTLGPGTVGIPQNGPNLQTFDDIAATFAGIHGTDGKAIVETVLGVDAVSGLVSGDDRPPSILLARTDGVSTTLEVRFSEPCREVLFADLYVGSPGDPGPRFTLTDADFVPAVVATGQVGLLGQPADGNTVVIDDAATSVTFEFDSDSSVVETPTLRQVVIGVAAPLTAGNLRDAINDVDLGFGITAVKVGRTNNLTQHAPGAAGNIPIAKSGANITVTGMQAGADAIPGPVLPTGLGYAWSPDGLGVILDYAPCVPALAADTLEVYGVRDLAGNQALAVAALPVVPQEAGEPAIDPVNSAMTVVPGDDNDVILVRFTTPMSPYQLLLPGCYSASPLDLSQATFSFNGVDEATITLNGSNASHVQAGAPYNLTLVSDPRAPLTTAQGLQLTFDDVETLVAGGDLTPISGAATSACVGDAGNLSTCVLVFPEAVERTGALTPSNYAIAGTSPTAVSFLTARTLRLTFAAAPAANDVLDVQPAGATDLGGNMPAGLLNVTLDPADATAPTASLTAIAVAGVGGDLVSIIFDEPVNPASALQASSYVFEEDGVPLDLTGASLRYDSTSDTVTLELPQTLDLGFGAGLAVVISGVTDLWGNPLAVQPVPAIVGGDVMPPAMVGAFVNWIRDGTGSTVEVFFDEAVDQAFLETPGNWSTSGGTPILAVERVAPDLARVTTLLQLGPGETLQLMGLPDLAGNAAGALAVDPLE